MKTAKAAALLKGEITDEFLKLWKEDIALRKEEMELSKRWLEWQRAEAARKQAYFQGKEERAALGSKRQEKEGSNAESDIAEEYYGEAGRKECEILKGKNKSWKKVKGVLQDWGYTLKGNNRKEAFIQALTAYNLTLQGRTARTKRLLSDLGYETAGSKQELADTVCWAVYAKLTGNE